MPALQIFNQSQENRVIVRAGRLIDGAGLPSEENVSLDIVGGVIEKLIKGGTDANIMADPGQCSIKILDFSKLTVMPGMIDCHVHLALDGNNFNQALTSWNDPEKFFKRVEKDLLNTLSKGIVAVRDAGDSSKMGLKCRKKILEGKLTGPMVMAAGYALRRQDKYGSFLGPPLNTKAINETVSQLAAQGVCQIKVLASGVVSFKEYGQVGKMQFSSEELKQIVAAAKDHGLKVMAHASSDPAVKLCIDAGVDSVEHGYFISPDSLGAMAEKNIAWIPTVIPVAIQARPPHNKQHSPESLQVIDRTYKRQLEMIALALETGVTLGVGTDAGAAGVLHGRSYPEELALLKRAGLGNRDIIKAATQNSAQILGLGQGTIEPGQPASLIAVEGNPMKDLAALFNVKHIILPGERNQ